MIQYRFSQAPDPSVPNISHYYGDQMRRLLMAAAAFMIVGSPFYTDSLSLQLPFIIIAALGLVCLAALANPHGQYIFFLATIASGAGVALFAMWALGNYADSSFLHFILRLGIALVFLAAFYFNMKTIRAFALGKVGKREEIGEFDSPREERRERARTWHEEFMPWFIKGGKSNGGRREDNAAEEDAVDARPRQSPGRKPEEIKPPYHPYEDPM